MDGKLVECERLNKTALNQKYRLVGKNEMILMNTKHTFAPFFICGTYIWKSFDVPIGTI